MQLAGLTQKAIADAIGVTTRTWINWCQGNSTPKITIRQAKNICELLKLPLDKVPDDFPKGVAK